MCLLRRLFVESFWFYNRIEREARRFPTCPLPPHTHSPRGLSAVLTRWYFILTKDEPVLIHHNHPESLVYPWVHLDGIHSLGLGKGMMTCVHHYNVIQSIFTALKVFLPYLISFPSPLRPLIYFYLNSYAFRWNLTVCYLSDWFLLLSNMHSMSFCVLITHVFLTLNNISLRIYSFTD